MSKWLVRWELVAEEPRRYLPGWVADDFGSLHARLWTLAERVDGPTVCHWDIREDNLLVRADGEVVLLDWGMARRGPNWLDAFSLAMNALPSTTFDDLADQLTDADTVTDLLIGLAGSQGWGAQQPDPPGVPGLMAFRAADAELLWAAAYRRLAAS